jgi:nicotinic acid mononucleotide adenylyltransferase
MKDYKQLIKELPAKSVVFAFGRFNPPTIGHELLVKAVKKLAQQRNADHVIYASRTQDAKKNPLSVEKKVKYLKLMFKSTNFAAANDQERTFIEAAKALNKKYKNIIMIAGSDRIAEFKRLLNTYNGKDFNFDTIEVVSAGERDPDADDATGMSASKMRSLAVKGSYSEFKKGLPSTVRDIDGKRLMNDIRDGMGLEPIKEQIVLVKDELREKFFRGEIFNEGDIVESAGERFTIVKRGSNHLLLKEASGNLVSKWIQDVQPTEEKEDMNEALTDKTLRPTDKIKVARIIATMLGIDNAETSSNPENLINQALRKVRTKALNPEALHILDKMLNLATEQGIQYDATLKPSKLKEGVTQIGGTDKIETTTDSVVVNKNSKYNIAKDILRFNDFKKLQKMNSVKEEEEVKTPGQTNQIGETLSSSGDTSDNLRRRKVKYHLGEQSKPPHVDMSAYEDESAHENSVNEQDDKAAKETAKANLMAKHAREKESLADKHTREKESLSELSTDLLARYKKKAGEQASAADKAGDYEKGNKRFKGIIKATNKQFDNDLKEEHIVHVDDGSNYGDKPHPKDVEHVNAGAKMHGGEFDGHSDKGAYFKFKSSSSAQNFKKHVDRAPHKSVYADLHEEKKVSEPTGKLKDACWKGYTAVGMKTKNGRKVPNCVPVNEEEIEEEVCPVCGKSPCECEKPSAGPVTTDKPFDPFFKEDEDEFDFQEPSDDDIESMADELSDDDYLDTYEDDELGIVDDETGEELPEDEEEEKKLKESALMEVLSRIERMKAKSRIRRTSAKRERATKIALKRYSNTATINKRARRLAIKLMKKRLLRGRDPSKVSVGEKERIERTLEKRKAVIGRIATRLAPRVRKVEKARLSHTKYTQGSQPSVF